MDFYNPQQLNEIYGDWNPESYMQGRAQVQSSNLSQGYAREQEAQKAQQAGLDTLFQQQNDPIKLRQGLATAQGTEFDNVDKGVKSRISAATEGLQLDAAKTKQILSASDDQIKMMANQAQQMAYSLDPTIAEKGKKLMMLSQAAVEARQKHAEEMEKVKMQRDSAERVAQIGASATRYSADARANIAAARNKTNKTIEEALLAAKTGDQRAGIYEQGLRKAMLDGDQELADYYNKQAQKERAAIIDKATAAAQTNAAIKPDLGRLGIPTVGDSARGGPMQRPPAAPPTGAINPKAIQMLQGNPALAAQFDAKYGAGASAQYLRK